MCRSPDAPPVICALDLGSTHFKAVMLDQGVEPLMVARRPAPRPRGEGRSMDCGEVIEVALGTLRDLVGAGGGALRVEALVVTGQRGTVIPLDVHGAPVGPALSWQDMRGGASFDAWISLIGHERFTATTGLPPSALWSVGKLLWYRDVYPESWGRVARFALLPDWILHKLGGGEPGTDPSAASLTGLFHLHEGAWSEELAAAVGLAVERLPAIRPSGSLVGSLLPWAASATGLPAGTPVVSSGGDQQCAALGAGAHDPGSGALCVGTAAVLSCPVHPSYQPHGGGLMCTAHVLPGRLVLEAIHNTFGSALAWGRALLGVPSPGDLEAQARRGPPGVGGPMFIPHLAGVGSPDHRGEVRARLVGLALSHGPSHVARAVYEGVCLELWRILRHFPPEAMPASINLVGGGAGGDFLPQMMASTLEIPLHVLPVSDATLRGAGILGWASAGGIADLDTWLRRHPPQRGRTVTPRSLPGLPALKSRYLRAVAESLALGAATEDDL